MEQLRKELIDVINKHQLALDAKFYVVKDVFRDIEAFYLNALKEMEAKDAEGIHAENMEGQDIRGNETVD